MRLFCFTRCRSADDAFAAPRYARCYDESHCPNDMLPRSSAADVADVEPRVDVFVTRYAAAM